MCNYSSTKKQKRTVYTGVKLVYSDIKLALLKTRLLEIEMLVVILKCLPAEVMSLAPHTEANPGGHPCDPSWEESVMSGHPR